MTQFSTPWLSRTLPSGSSVISRALVTACLLLVASVIGWWISQSWCGGHPLAVLLLVVGPLATAFGAVGVAAVMRTWRTIGQLLFRYAFFILVGAIIGTCAAVYLCNLLFQWVSVDLVAQADNPALVTWFNGPLTLDEISIAVSWLPGWVVLLVWPLQFPLFRDVISLTALIGFFNIVPVYAIWWERKVAGRIQSRVGPMRVGGWHGWAQSFADGIKLVFKEDLIPKDADSILFRMAPYFAIVPSAAAFLALPFGATYVFRELDVALVVILALLGIEVFAVILGGWASNNKWSVYGAMREACQMVSYEIPMGMALLVPIVCAGTLNLQEIGESQAGGWFSWMAFSNPFAFFAFVSYFIASLASCKRAPFDLPEAESELVGGFHTEYSGFRWALFFFAEYAAMFVVCGLAVILFLGGWQSPLPASWGAGLGDDVLSRAAAGLLFSGPIWFVLKCVFILYVQIWLRWTLPRIRIDQVLYACVQVLLPLTMVLLLGTTLWVWAASAGGAGFAMFDRIVTWILGLIGAVFALGFLAIAAYGFYHRRRLVGSLVIDVLPGS